MPPEPTVYIVDDDANVRDSLSLLLSTAGLQSQAFPTGEAFLEGADLNEPICVLLDVRLPGMSGLEVLERFAERKHKVAVIVITGHGDVPMAVAAMKSGAFHFVEKPFDPEGLLESVAEALRHIEQLRHEQARDSEVAASYDSLTPREQEVMTLLSEGLASKLVAARLGIATRTAEHHRAAVMRKMNARTLSHLVRLSLRLGARKAT
jgi:two-component system response regulator FixJ